KAPPAGFPASLPFVRVQRAGSGPSPGNPETTMSSLLVIIILGALSIVYGVWAYGDVMKRDAGSQRMQEIAGAVAEGAQAYLKRQYTTIAIVGIVLFALIFWLLGAKVAVGFLIGAVLSGAAGFIGMNVSV